MTFYEEEETEVCPECDEFVEDCLCEDADEVDDENDEE